MISQSVVLFNSSFAGSSAAVPITWNTGGRTAVVVNATTYVGEPSLNLQVQGPSGQWLRVGSSILSDQIFSFDSVPGQYRMANLSNSTVVGVNAVMIRIPY